MPLIPASFDTFDTPLPQEMVSRTPLSSRERRWSNACISLLLLIFLRSMQLTGAWITSRSTRPRFSRRCESMPALRMTMSAKDSFLVSLDCSDQLNEGTNDRTRLLQRLIDTKSEVSIDEFLSNNSMEGISIKRPAAWESMQPMAEGTWKVVYAPHMTTMASLAGGGNLDVTYALQQDGTMISHAKLDFAWLPPLVLSVSGAYGSVSDQVCRVDFDRAWITLGETPHPSYDKVPDDVMKPITSFLGKLFFIKQVSVFPISFLDENLIIFDFELLGTRICARKIN